VSSRRLLTVCRHEIAFVFGQLLSIHSVPALLEVLRDDHQSDMVRHEAAEALGGIGAPDLKPILEEWAKRPDAPRVVRESCEIAIDMWEVSTWDTLLMEFVELMVLQHENSGAFQYADGLDNTHAPPMVAAAA
jgi:deoxyhypusine monooxygenase